MGVDVIYGDAMNMDGFFYILLSRIWGYKSVDTLRRVLSFKTILRLPRRRTLLLAPKTRAALRRTSIRRSMEGGGVACSYHDFEEQNG